MSESLEQVRFPINESPFRIGGIIKQKDLFWGRKREMQLLIDRVRKKESTSIVGPRRIGKSSLGFQVYQYGKENLSNDFALVWVDGQSSKNSYLDGFLNTISKEIALGYVSDEDRIECLVNFEEAVESFGKIPVILINEFDMFTSETRSVEYDLAFYNTLRVLAEQGLLVLILIARDPIRELCKEVLGISSPFYNIFETINLIQFNDNEANEFLLHHNNHGFITKKGIRFIKRSIYDYRHPLILQIACDSVYRNEKDNHFPLKKLKHEIRSRVSTYLNHKEVERARNMTKKSKETTLNRTTDIIVSITLPTISVISIIAVLSIALREQNFFTAALIVLATIFFAALILIFAGRFTSIIGESTFYKLFTRILDELPIFSNLIENFSKIRNDSTEE